MSAHAGSAAAARPVSVPERPTLEGLEAKWSAVWERDGVYSFDRSAPRDRVFSIDTPPPTVSGSLHVGHVFSFTHTDTDRALPAHARQRGLLPDGLGRQRPADGAARAEPFRRALRPVGGVRPGSCSRRARPSAKEPVSISRPNFVELCLRLTESDEQAFEALWRTLGLSVDWSMTYTTIGTLAQRISQRSFLGLLARGGAYQLEAPTLWDVDFQTAVAQAELEDRERPGAMHRVRFAARGGAGGGATAGADRDDAPGADPGVRRAARPPRRPPPPRARRQRRADAAVRRRACRCSATRSSSRTRARAW